MTTHLAPGERLLWQGQPTSGIHFSPQDIFAIPFSILWLGLVSTIAVTVVTGEVHEADPMTFIIFPIFLLVGLYMLVGRFLLDMAIRSRTNYALTSRRAIIDSGAFFTTTRSVNLAATAEINYRSGRNGRGTIEFGSGSGPFAMLPRSWPGAGRYLVPAFDGIDDARHVYDLILKAQRETQGDR